MPSNRVAIIGDIGGHYAELRSALVNLGADPHTLELPDDLVVVQLGDLVHKGPDSKAVINLVDNMLATQPDQWVQLAGNHEGIYIHEPQFHWDEKLDDEDAATLQRWWDSGKMHAAVSIELDAGGETLITHAGVTYGYWRVVLDSPTSAKDAAERLEALKGEDLPWLWVPGEMLTGEPDELAGPMWASATSELYVSWDLASKIHGVEAPFHQVHGHSTTYNWFQQDWFAPPHLQPKITVNNRLHQTKAELAGKLFFDIDPGHGRRAARQWGPLVTRGKVTVPQGDTANVGTWLPVG